MAKKSAPRRAQIRKVQPGQPGTKLLSKLDVKKFRSRLWSGLLVKPKQI